MKWQAWGTREETGKATTDKTTDESEGTRVETKDKTTGKTTGKTREQLRRVEFVKYSEQGNEAYWYLNLLKKTTDQLDGMGFKKSL